MRDKVLNIFISHVHEDDERLEPLKELLAAQGITVRDGSINSDNPNNASNPEYIKGDILAPRIQWASTLVVLITPDTKSSDYVNWEIEYARKKDKRIVGVWDRGETGCEAPEALKKYADAVVPWWSEQVMDAILGKLDGWWERPGQPRSERGIARYTCH
jgi:hypothetical protein